MSAQPERLYFAGSDANSTETRQAVAVVQRSVVTSRAPAIVAAVVWIVTTILSLIW
jgi:hypothetical protein